MLNLNYNTAQEPHIIIVDDNPDAGSLFLSCFQHVNWHHQVKILHDTETLFTLLNKVPDPNLLPTLIILDYKTDHWNEEATLMLLKEDSRFQQIPIALFATSVTKRMQKQLLSLGARLCIKKPTTIDGMHGQVEELIALAKSYSNHQQKALS